MPKYIESQDERYTRYVCIVILISMLAFYILKNLKNVLSVYSGSVCAFENDIFVIVYHMKIVYLYVYLVVIRWIFYHHTKIRQFLEKKDVH